MRNLHKVVHIYKVEEKWMIVFITFTQSLSHNLYHSIDVGTKIGKMVAWIQDFAEWCILNAIHLHSAYKQYIWPVK